MPDDNLLDLAAASASSQTDAPNDEDPDETTRTIGLTSANLHLMVGRIQDASENPGRALDFFRPHPYENLDRRSPAEKEALGEDALGDVTTSLAVGAVAKVTAKVTKIPLVSDVPDMLSSMHSLNDAQKLYAVAERFTPHNPEDTALHKTIRNCAYLKKGKSERLLVAIPVAIGAGAVGTAGVAAAIVASGGLVLIPAAVAGVAGTAAGGASSFGAALTVKTGLGKLSRWRRGIAKRPMAERLLDQAISSDDGQHGAREAARAAIAVLRSDVRSKLAELSPDDPPDYSPRRVAIDKLMRSFE